MSDPSMEILDTFKKDDRQVKDILIHKNQAFLRKILKEWYLYTLKAFKSRMTMKMSQIKQMKQS